MLPYAIEALAHGIERLLPLRVALRDPQHALGHLPGGVLRGLRGLGRHLGELPHRGVHGRRGRRRGPHGSGDIGQRGALYVARGQAHGLHGPWSSLSCLIHVDTPSRPSRSC